MKSTFLITQRKDRQGNIRKTFTPSLRFTHEGKKYTLSTGLSIPSSLWLKKGLSSNVLKLKEAGWTPIHVTDTNARLDQLQAKLHDLYAEELLSDEFDIDAVKRAWEDYRDGKAHQRKKQRKTKGKKLSETILECIEFKRTRPQATTVNRQPITKSTLNNYMQVYNAVVGFDEYKGTSTTMKALDMDWYYAFTDFLWKQLKLNGGTPGKYIRNLGTVLDWADLSGVPMCRDFRSKEWVEPKAPEESDPMDAVLTWQEIEKLRSMDLSGTAEVARDVFCLACYTGMRAEDLENLNRVRIVEGKKGKLLQWKPLKPKSPVVTLALRSEIQEILNRWDGFPPSISSQKINEHIKVICEAAGFDEPMEGLQEVKVEVLGKMRRRRQVVMVPRYRLVTCHSARRSFCTNWFDDIGKHDGLNAELIMRWSGHKKRETFFIYINREPINDGDAMWSFVV